MFSDKNDQNSRKFAACGGGGWEGKSLTKNLTKMAGNWLFLDKKDVLRRKLLLIIGNLCFPWGFGLEFFFKISIIFCLKRFTKDMALRSQNDRFIHAAIRDILLLLLFEKLKKKIFPENFQIFWFLSFWVHILGVPVRAQQTSIYPSDIPWPPYPRGMFLLIRIFQRNVRGGGYEFHFSIDFLSKIFWEFSLGFPV